VLLYAEADRDQAVLVLEDLKTIAPKRSIVLEDELPMGGYNEFDLNYIIEKCRYIFILATENFNEDAMGKYRVNIVLHDFVMKNQARLAPLWLKGKTDRAVPREIAVLTGLRYYLYDRTGRSTSSRLFVESFRKMLEAA